MEGDARAWAHKEVDAEISRLTSATGGEEPQTPEIE